MRMIAVSSQSPNGQAEVDCFICFRRVAKDSENDVSTVSSSLATFCEAVDLMRFRVLEKADERLPFWKEVAFCAPCELNLQRFQEVKSQLETLNVKLFEIKKLISKTFFTIKPENGGKVSKLREDFLTASLFNSERQSNLECDDSEVITGDFHSSSDDDTEESMIDYHEPCESVPFPISRPPRKQKLEQRNVPLSYETNATHDIKPCTIQITRLEHLQEPVSSSRNESTKERKLRLQKLLQRHNSKNWNPLRRSGRSSNRIGRRKKERSPNKAKNGNWKMRQIKCPVPKCRRRFSTDEILRFHIRKNHEKVAAAYNCMKCDVEYERLADLRKHEDIAEHGTLGSETQSLQCNECRRLFKSRIRFDAHLDRQGGDCKGGKAPMPRNSIFDRSQKIGHRYICCECRKKFRSPHLLDVHIRASHTEGFAFLCEFCCKPFKGKQTMRNHQRQMHPEKMLASEKDADAALRFIKNLTCEICKITFAAPSSKAKHDARKHVKKFTLFCEVCGSGWLSKSELRIHSLTHSQDRNFPCTQCDLKFSRSDKLKRHVKVKHGDASEKRFLCEQCPKAFFDKPALLRHAKLRHRDKEDKSALTFSCDLCSYSCVIQEYLKIHRRTKKHMQKVADLGLTDPNTGLRGLKPA